MRVTFFLRYPVAAVMCDVLRATNRQKVQRVILATFRVRDNLSTTPCSWIIMSMSENIPAFVCVCFYIYRSLVKECPSSKAYMYFWSNFLYKVKVYSNECPLWSELRMTNECIHGAHAQPQAPCISEV